MTAKQNRSQAPSPRFLLLVIVVVAVVFLAVLATLLESSRMASDPSALLANSYSSELEAIMPAADADIGAGLINEHDCFACHILGDGSISPLFDGIGGFAADRRPPLTAEAYLYESVVDPSAYVLEGYSDSMPNTYDESLSQQEIGHIIAYLLTLTD